MIIAADWILPIASPPLRDGFVAVERGRIAAVGRTAELAAAPDLALPGRAILPGLINLHSHVDYADFAGLPDGIPFFDWLRLLTGTAAARPPQGWLAAARLGAAELLRGGVTCVADTSFSGEAVAAFGAAGMRAVVGIELFGRDPDAAPARLRELQERVADWQGRAPRLVRVGIAPHSPYTVAAPLWRAALAWAAERRLHVQVHLAETPAETEVIARGSGPALAFFGQDGLHWQPAGRSPVAHVAALGGLAPGMLAAHCVQVDDADVGLLRAARVAVAHCPRSNARLGCGRAPLERFVAAGLAWGLGTDSAASGAPLDLWEELRFALGIHRAAGAAVDAAGLLRQATLGAAAALGMDAEIGSLEPGKAADLIAVPLPPGEHLDVHAALLFGAREADVVMVEGEFIRTHAAHPSLTAPC